MSGRTGGRSYFKLYSPGRNAVHRSALKLLLCVRAFPHRRVLSVHDVGPVSVGCHIAIQHASERDFHSRLVKSSIDKAGDHNPMEVGEGRPSIGRSEISARNRENDVFVFRNSRARPSVGINALMWIPLSGTILSASTPCHGRSLLPRPSRP